MSQVTVSCSKGNLNELEDNLNGLKIARLSEVFRICSDLAIHAMLMVVWRRKPQQQVIHCIMMTLKPCFIQLSLLLNSKNLITDNRSRVCRASAGYCRAGYGAGCNQAKVRSAPVFVFKKINHVYRPFKALAEKVHQIRV